MKNKEKNIHSLSLFNLLTFSILSFFLLVVNTWTGLYFHYLNMLDNAEYCTTDYFSRVFLIYLFIGLITSLIIYHTSVKKIE